MLTSENSVELPIKDSDYHAAKVGDDIDKPASVPNGIGVKILDKCAC